MVPAGNVCAAYLIGVGRLRHVLVSGGAGAVLDLLLCVLLVPRWDASGAAAANVTAQLVTATLLLRAAGRQPEGQPGGRPGGYRALLRLPGIGRVVVVAAAAGAAAVAATQVLGGWTGLLTGGCGFLVVVLLGGRLCGVFDEDDAHWLRGALPAALAGVVIRLTVTAPPGGKPARTGRRNSAAR